jgi:hypothetical protein
MFFDTYSSPVSWTDELFQCVPRSFDLVCINARQWVREVQRVVHCVMFEMHTVRETGIDLPHICVDDKARPYMTINSIQ